MERRRQQLLRAWVTPAELDLFKRAAREGGSSLSVLTRTLLLLEADRLGIEQQPATEVRA